MTSPSSRYSQAVVLDVQPALGIQHARNDSQDLAEADAVIVVTGEPSTSGGLHAEFGMALALKKRLILVGPRENVFYTLPRSSTTPAGRSW